MKGALRDGAAVVCLALLAVTAAYPSLDGVFLDYDDVGMVVENPRLDDPSLAELAAVFTETREHAYLPVYVASYFPEVWMFGKDPRALRIASIVWLVAAAAAAYAFLTSFTGSRAAAFAGAAFLVVHPMTVESAGWIAGRKDLVSLLLFFGSLHAGRAHLVGGGRIALCLAPLALAAGLLAKATIVVQPAALLLVYWVARSRGEVAAHARPKLLIGACFAVAAALSVVHAGVAAAEGTSAPDPDGLPAVARALRFLGTIGGYVFRAIVPARLSIHYDVRPSDVGIGHGVGALVLAAAAFGAVRIFRGGAKGGGAFVWALVAWIGASLVPFNGVWPQTSLAAADRYFLVATPACGALLWFALAKVPHAVVRGAALAIVLGVLVFFARHRYAEFRDTETVFRSAMNVDPSDPLPPLKVGEALRKGPPRKPLDAAVLFAASAEKSRDPVRRARALVLAADAYAEAGAYDDALRVHDVLETALNEHGPLLASFGLDAAAIRHNACAARLGAGMIIEAREGLRRVLSERPDYGPSRMLGAQLDLRGAFETLAASENPEVVDRAREVVNRALGTMREVADAADAVRRDPRADASARAEAAAFALAARAELARTSSKATWRPNFLNDALADADRLVRDFPNRAEAYLARADVLRATDPNHADADAAKAAEVDSKNPVALRAFARVLLRGGRNTDALRLLDAAYKIAPSDGATAAALCELLTASGRAHLEGRGGDKDVAKARALARKAREYVADDPEAWALEAACAEHARDFDAAAVAYEAALRKHPGHQGSTLGLARIHQARGLALLMSVKSKAGGEVSESRRASDAAARERALAEFRAAAKLAPDADDTAFARGMLKSEDRTATVDPMLSRVREALARRSAKEALEIAAAAVKLDDAYASAWETLGHAAVACEDDARALEAFQRAADLDDENLPAALALARLRYRRGEYDEARRRAERFLKLASAFPQSDFLDDQIAAAKAVVEGCDAIRRSR